MQQTAKDHIRQFLEAETIMNENADLDRDIQAKLDALDTALEQFNHDENATKLIR